MSYLVHQLVETQSERSASEPALLFKDRTLDYRSLWGQICAVAQGLLQFDLLAGERVAIYLPKQFETVTGLFGTAAAGGTFVPVNPLLKAHQVAYILQDCNVRVLITSGQRLKSLTEELRHCHDLRAVVVVGEEVPEQVDELNIPVRSFSAFTSVEHQRLPHSRIDTDMAAILYTSGSTGNPKGVVLSHRNMVAGAQSVSCYLQNSASDRVLAILPLSFDAGLSQLTTIFNVGGSVVLMDYLLPRDVIRAAERHRVTGLAAVPPVWNQLATLDWPDAVSKQLRYITNTGGAMPIATTHSLQEQLPDTDIYLMYGLTEAFRSTYLPPDQVSSRPDSIGKAIPNAEILVVNENGNLCAPNEPGELVHRGALVAQGYWNDPEKTAERFKPAPVHFEGLQFEELAVWSGDRVRMDEEGYLYFISRMDDMIKTSGYRVSPTEIEEVVYASGLVTQTVALGLPHPMLGQGILLVASPKQENARDAICTELISLCQKELPNFMVPLAVELIDNLPLNQNGKIDRKKLGAEFSDHFEKS